MSTLTEKITDTAIQKAAECYVWFCINGYWTWLDLSTVSKDKSQPSDRTCQFDNEDCETIDLPSPANQGGTGRLLPSDEEVTNLRRRLASATPDEAEKIKEWVAMATELRYGQNQAGRKFEKSTGIEQGGGSTACVVGGVALLPEITPELAAQIREAEADKRKKRSVEAR